MKRLHYLIVNGAVLTSCAVSALNWRDALVTGVLLFLPLLDKYWSLPEVSINRKKFAIWLLVFSTSVLFTVYNPDYANFVVSTLIFTALPEEWFFRAYFMQQVQALFHKPWLANIITSMLFTLLHLPTQGFSGLYVLIPSLFYGWLYQRTNDLILLILVHAMSNIIFVTLTETSFY